MRALAMLIVGLLGAVLRAEAADVSFAVKPACATVGGGAKVSFAVSGPTDVEVAVLDGQGNVVRHLAGGVLGGTNAPPEPLKPGLAQELVWDGKDDRGGRCEGLGVRSEESSSLTPNTKHPTPFSLRVRLGMRAELDGFLAESKYWIGELCGLATDPQGNLYVYSSSVPVHRGSSRYLQVFNRKGEYLRTIMPMPANLPREKLKAFGVIEGEGTSFSPRNRYGTWPEFYPDPVGRICPTVTSDGIVTLSDGFNVARLRNDGTATDGPFHRGLWPAAPGKRPIRTEYGAIGPKCVVPSPDGKYLYLTGLCHAQRLGKNTEQKVDPNFPDGRIYRMPSDGSSPMERFADIPLPENVRGFSEVKEGYRGQDYYTAVHSGVGRGICDAEGRLLVCDRLNGMIRVYEPDGREAGRVKVEWPAVVACHRRSGAVYVMSNKYVPGKGAEKKLLKFSSWKADAKLATELAFSSTAGLSADMVLDDSADPPVLWASSDLIGKRCLLRIEDRGDALVQTEDLMARNKDRFGVKPRIAVHPDTDLIVCNDGWATLNAYNGLTGEPVKLPFEYGADMAVGRDGNWYVQLGNSWNGPICRFDRDMKPLPVGGADPKTPNAVGQITGGRMGAGFSTFGLTADRAGRVLTLQMYDWNKYGVGVFGADGTPVACDRLKDDAKVAKLWGGALVAPIAAKSGGIQTDWQGNVYLGLGVRTAAWQTPSGFEKDDAYRGCVGSVVKFGPDGGAITRLDPKDPHPPAGKPGSPLTAVGYGGGPAFVENALALYPGLGCLAGNLGDSCVCRQPMFQVDGWGRILYPNAITCSVRIVDNAGNLIQEFGAYGNIDSAGPKSMIATPAVPLGWPQAVAASHRNIYVADVLNRRIVRMTKVYAAEETVVVR